MIDKSRLILSAAEETWPFVFTNFACRASALHSLTVVELSSHRPSLNIELFFFILVLYSSFPLILSGLSCNMFYSSLKRLREQTIKFRNRSRTVKSKN